MSEHYCKKLNGDCPFGHTFSACQGCFHPSRAQHEVLPRTHKQPLCDLHTDKPARPAAPEYNLWASVLKRWLGDAALGETEAIERVFSDDFDLVCETVGVNVEVIRREFITGGPLLARWASKGHDKEFLG